MLSSRKTRLVRGDDADKLPVGRLPVVICPGFHDASLTQGLIAALPDFVNYRVLETSPIAPMEVYRALVEYAEWLSSSDAACPPMVGVGFSAGVVGLAGGLALWQQSNTPCRMSRLIAVDGWGVPLAGVPVTRFSHDRFTHLTSLPLGAGDMNFVAEPPVDHLTLWGQPGSVGGFEVGGWKGPRSAGTPMTAAQCLRRVLHAEWNAAFSWRYAADRVADGAG
ncbi:MAG: hypothetical protein AAFQ74_08210 [Cyanobacteria bacterium J06623_4]